MPDIDFDVLSKPAQKTARARKKLEGASSGKYRRAVFPAPGEKHFDVAIDATIRAAAVRILQSGPEGYKGFKISKSDLRKKLRYSASRRLIVFIVDSSGSMTRNPELRMRAAKASVLALLQKTYQQRNKIALITFGGLEATIMVPPSNSFAFARKQLEWLPAGGATPMSDALVKALGIVTQQKLKDPSVDIIFVIITDGDANITLTDGADPFSELALIAQQIHKLGIRTLMIESGADSIITNKLQYLAKTMQASYIRTAQLQPKQILKSLNDFDV